MTEIKDLLNDIAHRPFKLPKGNWTYYQEWNRALFLHWIVPFELLRKCVPPGLAIDTINGNCYISLVAFTMEKIRPRFLPPLGFLSDFDEINVRTYIDNDDKKGVYFLNIEAGKRLSAMVAKALSGLPYEKATIERTTQRYTSHNPRKGFALNAGFEIKQRLAHKSELDRWLTERYCLYLNQHEELYRYDIHHKEWDLKEVHLNDLNVNYTIGGIDLHSQQPQCTHYAEGIKVVAWNRQKL